MATPPQPVAHSVDRLAALVGAIAFAALVHATLPAGVTIVNDDFGYLRSVVATLQQGFPVTDDWLEPWSAGLSALSALAYKLTGSFQNATQGLQAALAGVSFGALFLLLRQRGAGLGAAFIATLLLLTIPTQFWKTLEYTGLILCLPCLLLALLAYEKQRWGLFFLCWALALTTRQSALAWGALPLLVTFRALASKEAPARLWPPALTLLGGIILFLILSVAMNKTHAQANVTDHVFSRLKPLRSLELSGIGLLTLATASGLGALLARPRASARPLFLWVAVALSGAALVSLIEWHDRIYLEHGRYFGSGNAYLPVLLLLGAVGWLTRDFRLDRPLIGTALAALVLVCLRRDVWDYYLIDAFALAVLAVRRSEAAPITNKIPTPRWHYGGALLAALGLLITHGNFIAKFKEESDRNWASVHLTETALRAGRVEPRELKPLPFGFIAWQLFPASLRRMPDGRIQAESFMDYLSSEGAETRFPAEGGELIGEGDYPYRWQGATRFQLVRYLDRRSESPRLPLPPNFTRPLFPLNDAEWTQLIQAPPARR